MKAQATWKGYGAVKTSLYWCFWEQWPESRTGTPLNDGRTRLDHE